MALNNDFIVKSGLVVKSTATVSSLDSLVTSNIVRTPGKPALDLNFTRSNTLDPRIAFRRASGATYVASDGTIKSVDVNVPRFNYDIATGQPLGFWTEIARTNLWPTSTSPITNYATGNICTVTNDIKTLEVASPVYKHIRYPGQTGDNNTGYIFATMNSGTVYTVSSYVWIPSVTTVTSVSISCDGGDTTFFPADLTKTNQWQRVWTTCTSASTTFRAFCMRPNGMTDGGYLYSSCWQLEAGTYPTSYIPTYGANASRVADYAAINGQSFNNFYNPQASTLLIETYLNGPRTSDGSFMADLYGGSGNDYIGIQYVQGSGAYSAVNYVVKNGLGAGTSNVASNTSFNAVHKEALSFDTTSIITYYDGVPVTHNPYTGVPIVYQLTLGGRGDTNFKGTGGIRRLVYYPQKLSAAQLQALTT